MKYQCRTCGRVGEYIFNPFIDRIETDYGHFKFLVDCDICRNKEGRK